MVSSQFSLKSSSRNFLVDVVDWNFGLRKPETEILGWGEVGFSLLFSQLLLMLFC